jgi:hypothetical protein
MECLEELLIGKAEALDTPIDTIKSFVEKFNSEILDRYPNAEITADISDLKKVSNKLELKWKAQNDSGVLSYDTITSDFSFVIN